jgi:hypothetical protein
LSFNGTIENMKNKVVEVIGELNKEDIQSLYPKATFVELDL